MSKNLSGYFYDAKITIFTEKEKSMIKSFIAENICKLAFFSQKTTFLYLCSLKKMKSGKRKYFDCAQ